MKEHPILFSTEMVKAILDGRKTQTRRIIKPQPDLSRYSAVSGVFENDNRYAVHWHEMPDMEKLVCTAERLSETKRKAFCPYGQAGDTLWVRETWNAMCFDGDDGLYKWYDEIKPADRGKVTDVVYKANRNPEDEPYPWIPSIHMPRWASRITLEVVNVRVERVQDISPEDCFKEGVVPERILHPVTPTRLFSGLWDDINGKRPGCSWNDNPFVWVVDFRKI